jgi:tripartite-type tricarboxylate transporter receptor subunit TctC
MTTIPFIMIVGGDQPYKTIPEYVAAAKAERLSYGHGGVAVRRRSLASSSSSSMGWKRLQWLIAATVR